MTGVGVPPSVFIGSSAEGLHVAEVLAESLERVAEPTVWTQDVFMASATAIESLEHAVKNFDFAVFVATPDDKTVLRGQPGASARDNIIFELGLFVGALGRSRTFLLHSRDQPPRLPSDLHGVTRLTYRSRTDHNIKAALGPAASQLRRRFEAQPGGSPRHQWFEERAGSMLERALKDIYSVAGDVPGLGVHVFLIESTTGGEILQRVVRRRSTAASPTTWGGFLKSQGVVGVCWTEETDVVLDLEPEPYVSATKSTWEALDDETRWGMNWDMFVKTRQRFKMIGAVPIADMRDATRGVLSLNLGKRSRATPANVWCDDVVAVLDRTSEILSLLV